MSISFKMTEQWKNETCFIIGGGSSLKDFDFTKLKGQRTLGCNDAYLLGEEICSSLIFGDWDWFEKHKKNLYQFHNPIYTSCPQIIQNSHLYPNIHCIGRRNKHFHRNALGWGNNTGFAALNLALNFGCSKIYLLGFDMKQNSRGETNWHDNTLTPANPFTYEMFIKSFLDFYEEISDKWPRARVINLTDDSNLSVFEKISLKNFHWNR